MMQRLKERGVLKIYAGAAPADLTAQPSGELIATGELPGAIYGETMTVPLIVLEENQTPGEPRYLRLEDAEGFIWAQCPVEGDIETSITLWLHAD